MNRRESIDGFLAGRRIAFVGVSSRAEDFSRMMFRELLSHGYDLVPVRPDRATIDGRVGYARVLDVPGTLDGVFLMTSPAVSAEVVRDCFVAGVKRVWMHRGVGAGAVSPEAVRFCEHHDIDVVAGECPLMFLPEPAWVHRAHAGLRRASGAHPDCVREAGTSRGVAAAVLVAHGAGVWALGAALMGSLLVMTGGLGAGLVHALVAALLFAAVGAAYARAFGHVAPLGAAAALVGVALVCDVVAAGVVAHRPLAGLAHPLGVELVALLGFVSAVVAGVRGAAARQATDVRFTQRHA